MAKRRLRRGDAGKALTEAVGGGLAQLMPDPDRTGSWELLIDGAPQSHVDLADPTRLRFEYQRRLGHVADLAAPPGRPLAVLHLGGGALTVARYIAATRPRSVQQVAEPDSGLTAFVRRELPLPDGARIRVRPADARDLLGRLPDGWADLVITDVFADARTPAHCTSAEFLDEVRRVLRPGGWYAANVTDGPPLAHLRAQVATAAGRFAEVCLAAEPPVLRGRRFGNGIVCAADGPLPTVELAGRCARDPAPARLLAGRELADFTAGAPVVTDATAVPSPPPPDGTFG
ncbi:fused MFS/spermidine synthase [Streptomyces sp. DSM 41886]|uniref:Fused MFS/spermidine synthase n=2 Tax=Streptomyces johnsoniae TaxID=3075532 RepID=A0ABU2S2R5_9ACTN|nr:fused MFS/spermidine synthase [Streptomyces sp. DSM 41886]MDT0443293.1 fused MFS/spermidine synthase [Streptomyces sp. DSM 41886]